MSIEERTRRFPILQLDKTRSSFGASIPWEVAEVFRDECESEHSQTLEELARRGGLSWSEIGNLMVRAHARQRGYTRRSALEWVDPSQVGPRV